MRLKRRSNYYRWIYWKNYCESLTKPEISGDFSKLMFWADGCKLKVRTNSETPKDTKTAKDFGAEVSP